MIGLMDRLTRLVRGLAFRWSSLFRGRTWRRELDLERQFHVEMEAEKLERQGLSPEEARRRAAIEFGGVDMVEEQVRDARGVRVLDDFVRDVRQGWRQLRRSPGFSLAAVVTLALGTGATVAIVSVVYGVLLAPLPFTDAERLTVVWEFDRLTGTQREAASIPDLQDFEAMNRTFAGMAAFELGSANLTGPDREARHLTVVRATHDLIPLLGLNVSGRGFVEEEATPGGRAVVVVSRGFWRAELGGSPDVIGQRITLDDRPHEIVGVLSADLSFPAAAQIWLPLQEDENTRPRYNHPITVVGRLSPGTSLEAAQVDMTRIASELEAQYPENVGRGVFVEPLGDVLRGEVRPALLFLLGAALIVLLIACVNVANLLLARGAVRIREFAIATALGATRGRLARRFVAESLLLTGVAVAVGVVLATVALRVMIGLAPPEVQALGPFVLERPILAVALLLCGVVGIGFGLVPLRQSSRLDPGAALGERATAGSAGNSRVRRLLVVTQMALAVGLLVQAALLIRSLANLRGVDAGFTEQSVLRADFQLPESRYPRDFSTYPVWPEVTSFNVGLVERMERLPGVESAAVGTNHPLDPGFTNSFNIVGRPAAEAQGQGELATRIVSSGYFETVGLPIVSGRAFGPDAGAETPMVLVLNEATVARYFPDENPIGQRLAFWGLEREVIGIVADERIHGLETAAPPAMYVPIRQAPPVGQTTLLVRTEGDPRTLVGSVRQQVVELDPDVALFNVATMEETVRVALARWRFTSALLTVFAAIALALAVVGVHGVLSFLVAQRTREIGVRMALGATRSGILGMIVSHGMRLALVGLVVGLGFALFGSRLLTGLLFGVGSQDPATYVLVCVTLLGAAILACAAPAMRATGVDPVRALKAD